MTVGTCADVRAMLTRMIDHLKTENITAVFTSLTPGGPRSSDRDGHLVADGHVDRAARTRTLAARQRRGLYVLKSRGMAHSNEIREFALTDHGLDIAANGGPHVAVANHGHATREGRDRHAAIGIDCLTRTTLTLQPGVWQEVPVAIELSTVGPRDERGVVLLCLRAQCPESRWS